MKKTKSVGTDSISAQKGITLIALIITIIVMLILVGVTITVVINGGLFSTAKKAANKTQIEIDREALQSAVLGSLTNTGEIDFTKLDSNLPTGFTGSNGTYTSASGNTFKVSSDGTIKYKEPSTGDLALLEEYCLDKAYTDVWDESDTLKFKNNDVIENAEEELVFLNMYRSGTYMEGQSGERYLYLKYNNKAYKIVVDMSTKTCEEVELVYTPSGREGETVAYDGDGDGETEEWVILYDNGDNVEIVSKENMGTLTLGYKDEETQGNTDLEKAIYSYNNAITRLNSYCESLITNTNKISVRSVGSNPDNPSSEGGLYSSDNLESWNSAYNGVEKSGDENAEQDIVRMSYYECNSTGTIYWLASRFVYEYSSNVYFDVSYLYPDGRYTRDYYLWYVNSSGRARGNYTTNGVRPVVKVSDI